MGTDDLYLHTPEVHGQFVTIALECKPCPTCGNLMLEVFEPALQAIEARLGAGHQHGGNTIAAQCERGGLVIRSNSRNIEGRHICTECREAGLSRFKCELCDAERPSTEIQESFGDPAEYLCKICYATKSAKTWVEAVKRLKAAHMYDFE